MAKGKGEIPNVLHVLGLCKNLLPIQCPMTDLNCVLSFNTHGFDIKVMDGENILRDNIASSLYLLKGTSGLFNVLHWRYGIIDWVIQSGSF